MAAQGYYRGCWLTDKDHNLWLPVRDVLITPHQPGVRRDAQIQLMGSHEMESGLDQGDIAYLYDFGPGDTLDIEPYATAVLRAKGTYRVRANGRAEMKQ